MTELLDAGFVDTFRVLYPDKENAYSWWSYMGHAREKDVKDIDLDKEIIRFRLTKIIEENEDGKLETKPYKRDEELVQILEELDEKEDYFRENYRKYFSFIIILNFLHSAISLFKILSSIKFL